MSIATKMVNYIENLQEEADRSCAQYKDFDCLLPNDELYFTRYTNLKSVCELIESIVTQSGKDLSTVLNKSIKPNLERINSTYPFVSKDLDLIIDYFG